MYRHAYRVLTIFAFAVAVAFSASAADPNSASSDEAYPYLKLDFENNPGWVGTIKAGYQWKLFRNAGVDLTAGGQNVFSRDRNFTKSGAAASVGLGYNFGDRLPLTVGLVFGLGPSGKLENHGNATVGGTQYSVYNRQKIKVYTLDASIDYDFKNCSRWTPFVGAILGVGFMSDRGHTTLTRQDGAAFTGEYGKKRRTKFVTGARLGTKYQITDRLILSLYGSYTYMGKVPHRNYDFVAGSTTVEARTRKAATHALDLKAGLKILF